MSLTEQIYETAQGITNALTSEWALFFCTHGRVPLVTDNRKPWTYPGWLSYYRLACEASPKLDYKVWSYWSASMENGALLPDPIPQVHYTDQLSESNPAFKMIERCIRITDQTCGFGSSLGDLMRWLLFGFGLEKERSRLPEQTQEQLYRTFNLEPLLVQPGDWIGHWLEQHKSHNPNAFFATPHNLCAMMVAMQFGAGDHRSSTVCDPALGTGRFLLHAGNHSLRLYGQDIDPLVIAIAKVNGALYCPWLVRPFPEHFFSDAPPRIQALPQLPEPIITTSGKHQPEVAYSINVDARGQVSFDL